MSAGSGAKAEYAPEWASSVSARQPHPPEEHTATSEANLGPSTPPCSKPSTRASDIPQTVVVGLGVGVLVRVAVGGVPVRVGVGLAHAAELYLWVDVFQ